MRFGGIMGRRTRTELPSASHFLGTETACCHSSPTAQSARLLVICSLICHSKSRVSLARTLTTFDTVRGVDGGDIGFAPSCPTTISQAQELAPRMPPDVMP